ncbi:glycosyltransferase [Cyanobium sp. FGCU-6]|nr:glycosyltransferase [Cyanobium sp. FGCU6]
MPVYGLGDDGEFMDFRQRMTALRQVLDLVVLVDNNTVPDRRLATLEGEGCDVIVNANRGGLAGGFNAGIRRLIGSGACWISLLDQDSSVDPAALARLPEAWERVPNRLLLVGPAIWDRGSGRRHGEASLRPGPLAGGPYQATRLLISSGSTFRAGDWSVLGGFHEELFIDFLDHAWSFRAGSRGFLLLQDERVVLWQRFGAHHPNPLCRRLGMQLYSPRRHYYGLRNLRWLCRQPEVPPDLKLKEVLKMLVKPWLWLLFEPQRRANARSILAALRDPLPLHHPHDESCWL